ncbi:MAG: GTPase Era [Deltaproteobacteria bacterium]|nr:GTPase Era [Deltaproteobacteria bacterium]
MSDVPPPVHRCGQAAIVGPPNAGKSTLLNRLVGEALSIVTPVPQTTRHRILGVLQRPAAQVALVDTPGFHLPRTEMNRLMIEALDAALETADAFLLLIAATGRRTPEERFGPPVSQLVERLRRVGKPTILALTKVDLVKPKERLLPLIEYAARKLDPLAVVPISPLTGDGVDRLVDTLVPLLPAGPPLWAPDDLTDRPLRFLAAERIREAATLETRQEVPHGVAVVVERWDEGERATAIAAALVVDRAAHKRILVGRAGTMIRDIGIRARASLAELLGRPVRLDLFVQVEEGWTRNPARVRELTGE